MKIFEGDLTDLRDALKTGQVSAKQVCEHYLTQIERLNPSLNALISVREKAMAYAESLDEKTSKEGLLWGVPLGIKDLFCTKGMKTTAGSKMLRDFVSPYTATAVSRLEAEGAWTLGKLNLDEFAMGSSNETSFFGPVRNPWNLNCVPGGSSGGSAAAVSAGLVPGALGTDTGGSIRQPAHFCGVVGTKPTYGRVSRFGMIAYASSLDQGGPMTTSVRDSALLLQIMSGHDQKDMTSSNTKVPEFSKMIRPEVKSTRVGFDSKLLSSPLLSEDVRKTFQHSIEALKSAGAELVEVELKLIEKAVPVYYLIATSEASSNLSRFDGVRFGHRAEFGTFSGLSLDEFYKRNRTEGFGEEVRRRILLGTFALSRGFYDAYYLKAAKVRRLIQEDYMKCFEKCDFMLSPVSTTTAFKLGEKIQNPVEMYLNDIFTVGVNLAGLPAMTVPFSLASNGLPCGLQLIAPPFEEQRLFNAGACLEQIRPHQEWRPNV
jgi:aspartyl-tRNA(Asn)/glutamyl-tRNA(Gln) amidotransferase subunit A